MTSSALVFRTGLPRPGYARARLLLGITGVGTAVLLALAAFAFDLPARFLSSSPELPFLDSLASVALVLIAIALVFLLFDMIGGALLVRRREWATVWFSRWARGAAVQCCLGLTSAAALLLAARSAGPEAALAVFVVLQLLLAAQRERLARAVAAFARPGLVPEVLQQAARSVGIDPAQLVVLDSPDEGFVGGFAGIGAGTVIVPQRWTMLPARALAGALARRQVIAASGAHARGVLGAVLWNSVGLGVVLGLSDASLATAAGLVTMAAGMTLWGFVGVLLLPTLSRHAVFAADRAAAARVGIPAVRDAIELLDRWQDDEPRRSRLVETIFHPVPSRMARLARLTPTATPGAMRAWHLHHLARHALSLSWPSLSPLSRLVHCNVGRPALWVMLPGD